MEDPQGPSIPQISPQAFELGKLPKHLQRMAVMLIRHLHEARLQGKIGPGNPITARQICEAYKRKHQIDLNHRDVRHIVEWATAQHIPIGSVNDGYFWVLTPEEWDDVDRYYMTYMKAWAMRLREARKMRRRMIEQQLYPPDSIMTQLQKELDLVEVPLYAQP